MAAAFVLYPIFDPIQASLDVGDPDVRPPTAYGLDNFALLPNYWEIMLNTLGVSFAAALMALVFGFVTAWILTRTNVPFRTTLEQLMAVPYYVTPLLGALAGACSARRKAASSTRSGGRWVHRSRCWISPDRSGSPG